MRVILMRIFDKTACLSMILAYNLFYITKIILKV